MKTILAVSVFALLSLPVMSVAASVYEMPAVLVTAERTEAEIRKEPQSAESGHVRQKMREWAAIR